MLSDAWPHVEVRQAVWEVIVTVSWMGLRGSVQTAPGTSRMRFLEALTERRLTLAVRGTRQRPQQGSCREWGGDGKTHSGCARHHPQQGSCREWGGDGRLSANTPDSRLNVTSPPQLLQWTPHCRWTVSLQTRINPSSLSCLLLHMKCQWWEK